MAYNMLNNKQYKRLYLYLAYNYDVMINDELKYGVEFYKDIKNEYEEILKEVFEYAEIENDPYIYDYIIKL